MDKMCMRLDAVGRYMSRLSGDALHNASRLQADALVQDIRRLKVVSFEAYDALQFKLDECAFEAPDRSMLDGALQSKVGAGADKRRPTQDGVALVSGYLTQRVVDAVQSEQSCSTVCKHFHKLGLVCPSEPTCAKIAALIAVARWGPDVALHAPDFELQHIYQGVKKELKRLYKQEPQEYVTEYPVNALEFLRTNPTMAKAVFSAQDLPITSPFSDAAICCVFNNIQQRGWTQSKEAAKAVQWMSVVSDNTAGALRSDPMRAATASLLPAPAASTAAPKTAVPDWFPPQVCAKPPEQPEQVMVPLEKATPKDEPLQDLPFFWPKFICQIVVYKFWKPTKT